jgi:hypothetical protein
MRSENNQFDFQINYNQMRYQLVFIVRTNLRIGGPMRTVQTTPHFSFWSFFLGSVSFISY